MVVELKPAPEPPGVSALPAAERVRDRQRVRRVGGGAALLGLLGLLTLLPVGFVVVNSFTSDPMGMGSGDWTLDAWRRAFSSSRSLESIGYSFLLSIRIPIGLAIAFVLAWLLVRVRIPGHQFIMTALWFAFFLPILPVTLGWILLLDADYGLVNELLARLPFIERGPFNIYSVPGIIWVHLTLSTIPIMTILLSPALRQVDASYEEAAQVSGAGVPRRLWRITLPLIAPAALTAFLAGLIRSLEVFEVEQLLGTRAGIFVYSTRIYNLIRELPPDFPQAMALSTLFLVFLLIMAIGYQRILRRYQGTATLTGKGVREAPANRSGWAFAASALIIGGLVVGVFLPLGVLLASSFTRLFGFFFLPDPWTVEPWRVVLTSDAFAEALRNSLLLGLGAGFLGTAVYFGFAWVLVRTRIAGRAVASILIWLPWAIPGILLGVAFLSVFTAVPGARVLLGTLVPLIVVIIIQTLPLGTHMIQTSIQQISGELEEAARSSGARTSQVIRRITLPLVAPMCLSVFVLVFMSAVRDISSTVLLATPGTRTLSLLMFEFAVGHRLESAAVLGVIIALLALAITMLAMRLGLKLRL
jgi:iron(III) transport system permease protein